MTIPSEIAYPRLLERNRELGLELRGKPVFEILCLGNVMQPQFREIMEYSLRLAGVNAKVSFGSYNTLVQDAKQAGDVDSVMVFLDAALLYKESPYALECADKQDVEALLNAVTGELQYLFDCLEHVPHVLVNEFNCMMHVTGMPARSALQKLCRRINTWVEKHSPQNVTVMPVSDLVASIGVDAAFAPRFFYAAKSPYTVDFLRIYAENASALLLPALGKAKKLLVADCDNTLWAGVAGELGSSGIRLDANDRDGRIYSDVQWIIKGLVRQGAMLALCSKNDESLVEEVFRDNQDMVLSIEDVVSRRINWGDKAENIQSIARELNVDLSSVVLIDDSSFECERVRSVLPSVTVWQVPAKRSGYPSFLWKRRKWFFNTNLVADDLDRTAFYRAEAERKKAASKFTDISEYLRSLDIKMNVSRDDESNFERVAELTQRTNQFNLMTRRFTRAELEHWFKQEGRSLFTFSASDLFGDYGTCGVCMLERVGNTARMENFMISCRVLGRMLEHAFMIGVLGILRSDEVATLKACYSPTPRNRVCQDFLSEVGFVQEELHGKTVNFVHNLQSIPGSPVFIDVSEV